MQLRLLNRYFRSSRASDRDPAEYLAGTGIRGRIYRAAISEKTGKLLGLSVREDRPRDPDITVVAFDAIDSSFDDEIIVVKSPRSMAHAIRVARQNRMIRKILWAVTKGSLFEAMWHDMQREQAKLN